MNFIVLPAQATRQIGLPDFLRAAAIAHTLGVAAGYSILMLDLKILSLITRGYYLDRTDFLGAVVITDIAMFPVSIALAYGCSRIGAIGFGSSMLAGSTLGFLAASPWAAALGPFLNGVDSDFEGIVNLAWTGAVIGLCASTFFWFVLRRRQPNAFTADRWSGKRFGTGSYVLLVSVFLLALPLLFAVPSLLERAQNTARLRQSEAAHEIRAAIIDEASWADAAGRGEGQFQHFVEGLGQEVSGLHEATHRAVTLPILGRKLLEWGEIEAARATLANSIDVGVSSNLPLVILGRNGDVAGLHLVCMRIVEERLGECTHRATQILKNWRVDTNPNWSTVWSPLAGGAGQLWRTGQLGEELATGFHLGSEMRLIDRLSDVPPGILRADALIDVGIALINQQRPEEAETVFEIAINEIEKETISLQGQFGGDVLFARMFVAWGRYKDLARARVQLAGVAGEELRRRLAVRLSGMEN